MTKVPDAATRASYRLGVTEPQAGARRGPDRGGPGPATGSYQYCG